jgi:transcriptional regulator GlxA family with amidase domain
MEIAVFIFDGMTTLDAIGPLEIIGRAPDADVKIVGKVPGSVRAGKSSSGLGLIADHAMADVAAPDILLIPGGADMSHVTSDREVLDWVRRAHETTTWTTSVCTGALVLGAAGVLDGKRATTHWASHDRLAGFGAIPVAERVVIDGKVMTGAGVSAGIDMALTLLGKVAGDEHAQLVQLFTEYDPQPPYRAGSLETAPASVVARARSMLRS